MVRGESDTRERIKEVALQLFETQGYDRKSLREIAERVGVTKAALYYHFKSKDAILNCIFEGFFAEVEALGDSIPDDLDDDGRRRLIEQYAEIIGNRQEELRFMLRGAPIQINSQVADRFRALVGRVFRRMGKPNPTLHDQVRMLAAIYAIDLGTTAIGSANSTFDLTKHSPEEIKRAIVEVAQELMVGSD